MTREIKEKFLCRLKAIHKAQRVRRLIQLAQEEQEGKTEHYSYDWWLMVKDNNANSCSDNKGVD